MLLMICSYIETTCTHFDSSHEVPGDFGPLASFSMQLQSENTSISDHALEVNAILPVQRPARPTILSVHKLYWDRSMDYPMRERASLQSFKSSKLIQSKRLTEDHETHTHICSYAHKSQFME